MLDLTVQCFASSVHLSQHKNSPGESIVVVAAAGVKVTHIPHTIDWILIARDHDGDDDDASLTFYRPPDDHARVSVGRRLVRLIKSRLSDVAAIRASYSTRNDYGTFNLFGPVRGAVDARRSKMIMVGAARKSIIIWR